MKILFKNLVETLAEAALLEEGIPPRPARAEACDPFSESFEENLIEVAFAEAADYDDIHRSILNEHLRHCKAA